MPKTSYTDNTIAEHPPGGKHHKMGEHGDELPSEQGGKRDKKKAALSQERAAKSEK